MRTLRPTAIPPTALAVAVAAVKAAASSSAAAAAGTQEEEGGYQTQGLRSSCAHTLDAVGAIECIDAAGSGSLRVWL